MRFALVVLVALGVSGCTNTVAGTTTTEPNRVDCDLIFPGPDHR